MSVQTAWHKSMKRNAVVAATLLSALSMIVSFAAPAQAHAVSYSQLLAARSAASASKQRVANLKSQLSGVSASLQQQILDLDDLTNNQIPAAQDAVDSANDASANAQDSAQAAAQRLAAAQKDRSTLQEKIKQTGKDYDDAHAAVAEVARAGLHGSKASDTMSIMTNSKSASDYVDSMQSATAVSRNESENANSAANDLSLSKNREQRLAAIEDEITNLKNQADAEAASAKQAASDAAAKAAQLAALRDEGTQKRAALQAQQASLQSSSAKEAAADLIVQSQVDSYNQQWSAQQAAAARNAAANASRAQGTTRPTSSSRARASSSPAPSRGGGGGSVSAGRVNHPTGDSGNAYPFSQCTWWAYIRRHQLGLPVGSYFGNGGQWWSSAMRLGYQVNHTPSVGAIVSYLPGQNGSNRLYGHVAIVERVNSNGTILTSNCGAVMNGRIYYQTVSNVGAYWYIHN